MKKCVYCKTELKEDVVLEVCINCGRGIWGEKMFNTIVKSMEDADSRGSLMQGSVGSDNQGKKAI
ncbi:MAG: DUF2180 family protein [Nanoarchaeota archaeon]